MWIGKHSPKVSYLNKIAQVVNFGIFFGSGKMKKVKNAWYVWKWKTVKSFQ